MTAWAPNPEEAIARMDRALREYRIRGVTTNLAFLEAVLEHPDFRAGNYTTRFIDNTPELFNLKRRQDRATKLLRYIADVTVNGHPEVRGKPKPSPGARAPQAPDFGEERQEGTTSALIHTENALAAQKYTISPQKLPKTQSISTVSRPSASLARGLHAPSVWLFTGMVFASGWAEAAP